MKGDSSLAEDWLGGGRGLGRVNKQQMLADLKKVSKLWLWLVLEWETIRKSHGLS